MRVVVCGGGVIGACTALFLSRRGVEVTVVERTEVAAAASGKAGGFLALDWCAGTPLDALARRSFHLHATLVDELAGDWAYQRMSAYSGSVAAAGDRRSGRSATRLPGCLAGAGPSSPMRVSRSPPSRCILRFQMHAMSP